MPKSAEDDERNAARPAKSRPGATSRAPSHCVKASNPVSARDIAAASATTHTRMPGTSVSASLITDTIAITSGLAVSEAIANVSSTRSPGVKPLAHSTFSANAGEPSRPRAKATCSGASAGFSGSRKSAMPCASSGSTAANVGVERNGPAASDASAAVSPRLATPNANPRSSSVNIWRVSVPCPSLLAGRPDPQTSRTLLPASGQKLHERFWRNRCTARSGATLRRAPVRRQRPQIPPPGNDPAVPLFRARGGSASSTPPAPRPRAARAAASRLASATGAPCSRCTVRSQGRAPTKPPRGRGARPVDRTRWRRIHRNDQPVSGPAPRRASQRQVMFM